jgi:hypothetical protein
MVRQRGHWHEPVHETYGLCACPRPPHHGQAVMVELMLRGLGGNKPQITQISQMKEVDRAVPGAMGSTNAQSASFIQTGLTRLTGLRERPQIAQISQMEQVDRAVPGAMGSTNAQSASFIQTGLTRATGLRERPQIAQISQMGRVGTCCLARPGSGEEETLASVEGCSRTRERLDEKTLDLPKSSDFGYDLPISSTEVGHRGTGVPTRGNSTDARAAHPYHEQTT